MIFVVFALVSWGIDYQFVGQIYKKDKKYYAIQQYHSLSPVYTLWLPRGYEKPLCLANVNPNCPRYLIKFHSRKKTSHGIVLKVTKIELEKAER